MVFQNRLFQWSVLGCCSNTGYRGQAVRHREKKKFLLVLPYGEKSAWSYALRYHNAEWHRQFPEDHLNVIWERDFQRGPKIFPQQKSLIFTSHDRKTASPNDYSYQKTGFLLKEITTLCSYSKKIHAYGPDIDVCRHCDKSPDESNSAEFAKTLWYYGTLSKVWICFPPFPW